MLVYTHLWGDFDGRLPMLGAIGYLRGVKLSGDPQAIETLKALHKKNPGYMKALIEDARSTTDLTTYFKDEAGIRYRLTFNPTDQELTVEPAGNG